MSVYKQTSIKQATAAHHEKILMSYTEINEPPSGILRPLINTVYKSISVPFKYAPCFQTRINDIAKRFSLEITDTVKQFWELRKTELRYDVRSLKDELYKSLCLNAEEQEVYTKTL